jgi:hypothetical protein
MDDDARRHNDRMGLLMRQVKALESIAASLEKLANPAEVLALEPVKPLPTLMPGHWK